MTDTTPAVRIVPVRKFEDQRAQATYDLFARDGWMRGDIERFYRAGFMNVGKPNEGGSPRDAAWLAGRDRSEAGLPHLIPVDRPEFAALGEALAASPVAPAGEGLPRYDICNGGVTEGFEVHPDPNGEWVKYSDIQALRARSEPEAGAVAWRYRWKPTPRSEPGDWREPTHSRWSVQDRATFEEQPLYAHPTPADDRLAVAVEALKPFAAEPKYWSETATPDNFRIGGFRFLQFGHFRRATEALALLTKSGETEG